MKIDIGGVKILKVFCGGCNKDGIEKISIRLEFNQAVETIDLSVKQAKDLINDINYVIEEGCEVNLKSIKI